MFKVGEIVKYAPQYCGEGEQYYIHEVKEADDGCYLISTLNTMLTLGSTERVTEDMIQKASKYEVIAWHGKYIVTDTESKKFFAGYDFMGSVEWVDSQDKAETNELEYAEQYKADLESADEPDEPEEGIDPAELDECLDRINDLAWEIINKKDLQWVYPTEPIYPLKWYICYGKAPVEFIKAVMNFGKRTLANILVTWRDNDTMDIIRKIERRIL